MKNINFKRKESVFRSLNEEKLNGSTKPINWDRIIYFVILAIILFILFRFLFLKFYYVKANGQILFKNVDIQTLEDCRIIQFQVEEGDTVKIGDTLFHFINNDAFLNISYTNSTSINKNNSWIEKEIFELETQISFNNNELNQLIALKKINAINLEKAKHEVMLDALPKSFYTSIENKIVLLSSEIILLKNKNEILRQNITKLKLTEENKPIRNNGGIAQRENSSQSYNSFISPIFGTVTQIFKQNQEVALKSEIIMYIHKHENIYIKGFFNQDDVNNLKVNDLVEIEFPDGSESLGKINRFFFATYRLPEEFQKKYEPTTRSLSVDIIPLNKEEFLKWRAYYKMSVIIRKKRF